MNEWFAMPREWIAATGEIGRFFTNVVRRCMGLRVFRFFGEALRQSGILIISSTLVIWVRWCSSSGLDVRDRGRVLHPGPGCAGVTRVCSRRGATCARRRR